MANGQFGQQSCVGIFWQVKGRLVTRMVPLDKAEVYEGRYDIADDHYSFWEKWTATQRPDLAGLSYDYFPRGRVVYVSERDEFSIYADRCLLAQKRFAAAITRAFALSGRGQVFKGDAHYQCHRCNPHYLSDPLF